MACKTRPPCKHQDDTLINTMTDTTTILFATNSDHTPEEWITPLQKAIPRARLCSWSDSGDPVGAQIAIAWNPPANLMQREPGIRAIFNLGAGVDALLQLPGLRPDVTIIRLEDAGMAVQMAEYALHALLRVSRQFSDYDRQQAHAQWRPLSNIRRRDWPVGVLGLGKMGLQVAQTIAAFGYPVAGWSRTAKQPPHVEAFSGNDSLPRFLARTRVLINTLPLTPETTGLLNLHTLSQLQPGSYLVNIGRGEHLVEADLLQLLQQGHLAGAALDVFAHEPLPADPPFWRHPHIIVTPHIAAPSLHEETMAEVSDKINRYLDGETPSGTIQRGRGY